MGYWAMGHGLLGTPCLVLGAGPPTLPQELATLPYPGLYLLRAPSTACSVLLSTAADGNGRAALGEAGWAPACRQCASTCWAGSSTACCVSGRAGAGHLLAPSWQVAGVLYIKQGRVGQVEHRALQLQYWVLRSRWAAVCTAGRAGAGTWARATGQRKCLLPAPVCLPAIQSPGRHSVSWLIEECTARHAHAVQAARPSHAVLLGSVQWGPSHGRRFPPPACSDGAGHTRFLVRGRAGATPAALLEGARQEAANVSRADGLPAVSIEAVGGGMMEW